MNKIIGLIKFGVWILVVYLIIPAIFAGISGEFYQKYFWGLNIKPFIITLSLLIIIGATITQCEKYMEFSEQRRTGFDGGLYMVINSMANGLYKGLNEQVAMVTLVVVFWGICKTFESTPGLSYLFAFWVTWIVFVIMVITHMAKLLCIYQRYQALAKQYQSQG
jgi:hypothetical protein